MLIPKIHDRFFVAVIDSLLHCSNAETEISTILKLNDIMVCIYLKHSKASPIRFNHSKEVRILYQPIWVDFDTQYAEGVYVESLMKYYLIYRMH